MIKHSLLAYGSLLAVWGMIVGWQVLEHNRVKESARTALINRSRSIATTLGVVIRSQRWRGVVFQDRVEPALKELVNSGELISVALLNASGGEVISAGAPIDPEVKSMLRTGERWDEKSVAVVNLVDLGADVTQEGESSHPTIILPGPPRPPRRPPDTAPTNSVHSGRSSTNPPPIRPGPPREGESRRRFGRPPGMDENEYKSLIESKGLHGFVMVMSTQSLQAATRQDLWVRWIIGGLGGISVIGFGLAWRNLIKSSDLQMRLLRASELNSHLRGMNVAAAGLAHETRNPLNIIRGLAQMISREKDAPEEIRKRSREMTDEVDRVTAQLNEFINYSKPREVRRASVPLEVIVSDVVRALKSDLEDQAIQLNVSVNGLTVEADEQMLRQVLFNLLINAIQAVEPQGEIQIVAAKSNSSEAFLELRDNGPGVSPEQRGEIFKPYFTTHQKGTGLGLAIVQQIVLAHGWDIEYISNEPKGAIFRLSRLKSSSKN